MREVEENPNQGLIWKTGVYSYTTILLQMPKRQKKAVVRKLKHKKNVLDIEVDAYNMKDWQVSIAWDNTETTFEDIMRNVRL